jgi:hypothetical protein
MSKIEASILGVGGNSIRLGTCRNLKGIAIGGADGATNNKHEAFRPDLL